MGGEREGIYIRFTCSTDYRTADIDPASEFYFSLIYKATSHLVSYTVRNKNSVMIDVNINKATSSDLGSCFCLANADSS